MERMKADAQTKVLGIIGTPIEHTKSPLMHAEFAKMTDVNCVYAAFDVTKERLGDAICGIRALGIKGVNVTAPHKFEVIKYLDEVSEEARLFGSVNTVVNIDGKLVGYNTDAEGFYRSLLAGGTDVAGKDILIFGAGGATQPIVILFALKGAKSITVINRTEERAERLKNYVKSAVGYDISTKMSLSHYDIVINTTSAGMAPQVGVLPYEDLTFVDSGTFAADMIYNPAQTEFLKQAELRGARTINGLGMLIYQGIIAYELFTDTKLPDNAFEIAKRAVLD